MTDASFADGDPGASHRLALRAEDAEGLAVISALMQDAVGKTVDTAWMPTRRIFALVVNRFRWEQEAGADAREGGAFERCRCGLHAENVLAVRATGFDPDKAGEDGTGIVRLDCSGGAAFALDVEALDVRMADLDAIWKTDMKPRHDGIEP
jgi:hypothetical protein